MSDETTTPATDTVDPSAPQEGHAPSGEPVIDWEQRYNSLRPEFDRTKQQLSEHEQRLQGLADPQTRADILKEYGLELAEEEIDTPEFVDPYDELRAELDALKSERQQELTKAQEEAQEAAVGDFIYEEITKIESEIGRELDREETEIVSFRARQLAAAQKSSTPLVKEAWQNMSGLYDQHVTREKTKPKQRWGGTAPAGQSASKQPDLSNESERAAYIDSRLSAID